jgi:hypothetical protein
MPNFYYYLPKTTDEEMEAAMAEFLARGGKIQQMRDDGGTYDKALKKTKENLKGGFNPFSKDQALTINKDDFK